MGAPLSANDARGGSRHTGMSNQYITSHVTGKANVHPNNKERIVSAAEALVELTQKGSLSESLISEVQGRLNAMGGPALCFRVTAVAEGPSNTGSPINISKATRRESLAAG